MNMNVNISLGELALFFLIGVGLALFGQIIIHWAQDPPPTKLVVRRRPQHWNSMTPKQQKHWKESR